MAVSFVRVAAATATSTNTVSVDMDTTDCDHVHVMLLWRNDAQTISSLTREGAATTLVGTDNTDANERVSCGMRRSASAGTATDTFAATLSGSSEVIRIVVIGLSGVDSGSPVVSADTNEDIGSNPTIATDSTTVAAGNLALSSIVVRDNVTATLADNGGANTTDRDAIAQSGGVITWHTVSFTDTRTVTWTWTEPGAGNWSKVQTVVYAAAAGGGGVVGPLLAGHLTGRGILGGRLIN